MNSAQEISEIIISLLKTEKISTNRMLSEIGLHSNMINDMKKGSMPSADKLGLIAEYFNISVDYLLGRTDNPKVNK